MAMIAAERQLEEALVTKLRDLKYKYRPEIRDRATLEQNFREKFEALNRVHLTDSEFARLIDEIVTPDVFTAARTLRERNSFTPVHPGRQSYRSVKLSLLAPEDLDELRVLPAKTQPD